MRFTGARPGETRKATVADVDFESGLIVLDEHKTRWMSKRPRVIYLNVIALRLVRWLVLNTDGVNLFVNGHGKPWSCRALDKYFAAVRRRAGLKSEVKLHGCRHGFSTNAIVNGVDIATLAQLLGHASIASTWRYIHLARRHEYLSKAAATAVGLK
jgi:site-specific recombinase XerD